jgi:hypothetical protein
MLAGLWNAAGSTVSGIGSAIGNVWKGITSGIGNFTSSFFPAAQKVTTVPAITAPAGGIPNAGYRAGIMPQGTSFMGEGRYIAVDPSSVQPFVAAQPELFGVTTSQPSGLQKTLNGLFAGMKATAENVTTFKSLADSITGAFTKQKPIVEGPDGTAVTNINPTADMSSSVGTYLTGVNQALSDMVKGLFNLGYSGPQGAQPTVPVKGEYATTTNYSTIVIVAAVVIGLILFLRKK